MLAGQRNTSPRQGQHRLGKLRSGLRGPVGDGRVLALETVLSPNGGLPVRNGVAGTCRASQSLVVCKMGIVGLALQGGCEDRMRYHMRKPGTK